MARQNVTLYSLHNVKPQTENCTFWLMMIAHRSVWASMLAMNILNKEAKSEMKRRREEERQRRQDSPKKKKIMLSVVRIGCIEQAQYIAVGRIICRKLSRQIGRSAMQLTHCSCPTYSIDVCFHLCISFSIADYCYYYYQFMSWSMTTWLYVNHVFHSISYEQRAFNRLKVVRSAFNLIIIFMFWQETQENEWKKSMYNKIETCVRFRCWK